MLQDSKMAQVRVILTDEELQLPAIDDLCNKYCDWLKLSKESAGGRKTRAANRRVDTIYDEIMGFKLPPVKLDTSAHIQISPTRLPKATTQKTSIDSGSSAEPSELTADRRTLRPRCRTPSVSRKQEIPCTPTHQGIRSHIKKTSDSSEGQSSGPASMTKIRALLRLDSAKKKREEEKERQDKIRLERKVKEEKAEAQKKKMLEERAQTAKMSREQRLMHAAEVRKARERAEIERKLREPTPQANPAESALKPLKLAAPLPKIQQVQVKEAEPRKLDETYQKPNSEDNINISIFDETSDEPSKKPQSVAKWAKAPDLRNHVMEQFKKSNEELMRLIIEIFGKVKLPVDLDDIFASHSSNRKYLARSSSACWTPPPHKLPRNQP